MIDSCDSFTFVTLAGGGLFVVNPKPRRCRSLRSTTRQPCTRKAAAAFRPSPHVHQFRRRHRRQIFIPSRYAATSATNPPNTPAPTLVYTHDGTNSDSHGAVATRHERYLWVAERFGNNITVVDTDSNAVINQFGLVGRVSNDPTPDLMDISPDGKLVFMSLRGPNPLTGNNPAFNNAVGSTPGVGIIRVQHGGRRGKFIARLPISHIVGGIERADPHGLRVLMK